MVSTIVMVSANAAMTSSFDYSEVARSVLIAILASYAALDLAGRVTAARGWVRLAWLAGGAAAMGLGIWTTHFKGMLAFHLPVPVSYHWPTVALSLLLAISASAFALYIVSRPRLGLARASLGSVIMGGGIACMHYLGMASMRLPATMRFHFLIVILAVALAIVFSFAALMLAFDLREETKGFALRKMASALVMGAAVSAMHYVGMASVSFIPSAVLSNMYHAGSISSLGNNGIAIVTVIVLAAACLTSSVDRKAEAELRQLNEELEHRVIERTTQLADANEELEKLRDQLRLVINTIPAMVWSALPDGSIDFVNQRWLNYFGLPFEKIRGHAWTNAIHPETRASTVKKWHAALAKGEPFEFAALLQRGDGDYRWFVTRSAPLRDEQGRIAKWYGTKTDVEDRKRADDELRKQKEILEKIFEHIPAMIAFIGKDRQIELVNPEWERTIGWTLKELHEQNLDIFAEAYPDPQYRQMVLDFVAASTGEWTDLKVRVRDGRVIDAEAAVVHLSDGTSVAIGQDISERKRAEAALQEVQARLARITHLVAMGEIAHEVNQPLAAIVTNANFSLRQLATAAPNLEGVREAIVEIANDGARASAIIARIRGRLQKGTAERIELDLNQIIQEVTALLRAELARNRVSLLADLAVDLPRVSGDRIQIEQVLINLVMNGVEAMHSLHHRRRELMIRSARNHNEVFVQVQDSGEGLDPQQFEQIFEPFFTTKPKGIGMGLAISRSIIESHGGRLWAESNTKGALFQFSLPVQE